MASSVKVASCSTLAVRRQLFSHAVPRLPMRRANTVARAHATDEHQLGPMVALSSAVTTLMASGNALAANELVQVAANDGRASLLYTLFVPALGWVAFNIASGFSNQMSNMDAKAKEVPPERRSLRLKRSVVGALGLGMAGLMACTPAQAVAELAQVAESDGRGSLLWLVLTPALGWVAFNIAAGFFNQMSNMDAKAKDVPPERRSLRLKRSVAGALGLGMAGLMATAPAQATTELAQLAASDGRAGLLWTLFIPALGWVAFNIASGFFNQLDRMGQVAKDTPPVKRSIRRKK